MRAPPIDLSDIAADILGRLRERRPRVHCITNAVAQAFTANVLLAVGAVPSMTTARDEVSAFTARADALLVNLGTFDAERRAAADLAIAAAQAGEGKPWVLDPVLIGRSPSRAEYARSLLARGPAAVRLNAAEFETLAAAATPQAFAGEYRTIVARTGEKDLVADASRVLSVANGHILMSRVTAMGCAESALVAAALAVEADPFLAAASALVIFGIAGDIAGERAKGPGSFGVELLDALYGLDRAAIRMRAKVMP